MTPPCDAVWLGSVPYMEALELQRRLHGMRVAGLIPDTLLLLEHPHVFTLGRRARQTDVLGERSVLERRGVEVVTTDRGGETTYHGPGQLVGYPIFDLRALGLGPSGYVCRLELAMIDALTGYAVPAHRVEGRTGVWTGGDGRAVGQGEKPAGRKIAAIGVRISRGVSMHGFALNVSTDLSYFGEIVPCGMPGLDVASIESDMGAAPPVEVVGWSVAARLAERCGLDLRRVERDALLESASATA